MAVRCCRSMVIMLIGICLISIVRWNRFRCRNEAEHNTILGFQSSEEEMFTQFPDVHLCNSSKRNFEPHAFPPSVAQKNVVQPTHVVFLGRKAMNFTSWMRAPNGALLSKSASPALIQFGE